MPIKREINKGEKFNLLTFLEEAPRRNGRRRGIFQCDCGNLTEVDITCVRSGVTKSCKCISRKKIGDLNRSHGATANGKRMPEYSAWKGIKYRCFNPNARGYKHWGGRGITVCDRWKDSFENFLADMGKKPSPSHSIDRIDVNGNYEPSNCRWATRTEQLRNKRTNRNITLDGVTRLLCEWSEISGVSSGAIADRLQNGWDVRQAIFQKPIPRIKEKQNELQF